MMADHGDENVDGVAVQNVNGPPPEAPTPPSSVTKQEIDSSTFVKTKAGLKLMTNFTFKVKSHSLLNDKEGNSMFLLSCGTKTKVFRVPVCLSDTDTLRKIIAQLNKGRYNEKL